MHPGLESLVAQMELSEKATLLAGADMWSTVAIPRLDIPAVNVTDGPNGARGPAVPSAFNSGEDLESLCVPCATALGASWDVELVEAVGSTLGRETRTKACRVLLAPTVNLHRSPLAGRNFESYSEDPLLAGRLAAAFVRGVQSEGVACTVKHFAGNEAETDRMVADTIADERTLRELYLMPFELAVREGGALGIMTSYNRLNGEYCADSVHLLTQILRTDWCFEGFVVSDWFALADTQMAVTAGLDLEMPGPGRAYGPALEAVVRAGDIDEALLDAAALRLLRVFERIGALDDAAHAPTFEDQPEHRDVARRAASAGAVLLKNEGVLPLDIAKLRRVAVIGPNAGRAVIMGGGAASLTVPYLRSPVDALRDRLGPDVEVIHEPGVDVALTTPEAPSSMLSSAGKQGMTVEFFAEDELGGNAVATTRTEAGSAVWFGLLPIEVGDTFAWRAQATLTVPRAGSWLLSLVQTQAARLLVDGRVVLDGHQQPLRPGADLMGMGKAEITCVLELTPEHPAEIQIDGAGSRSDMIKGAKLGIRPAAPTDGIERAVRAAAGADTVIVVVGTDGDWETEGRDRETMGLPGEQDELVTRVLEAAPDAVVVLNTGAPVATPWAAATRALLQMWFGGQEMADGLADVLFGDTDPGGRLPTTMPRRLEDTPSWGNFPPQQGQVTYGEGLLVGYRWYESRKIDVAFPFGHGLSYTTFEIGQPAMSSETFEPANRLVVTVPVTNIGERPGTEVVQLYVAPRAAATFRPEKELKAFAKVALEPGQTASVTLTLDGRSFARWSAASSSLDAAVSRLAATAPWVQTPQGSDERGWIVDAGAYELRIGRSSADIAHVVEIDVPERTQVQP